MFWISVLQVIKSQPSAKLLGILINEICNRSGKIDLKSAKNIENVKVPFQFRLQLLKNHKSIQIMLGNENENG